MKELEKIKLLELDGAKVAYYYNDNDVTLASAIYNAAVSIRNFFGD